MLCSYFCFFLFEFLSICPWISDSKFYWHSCLLYLLWFLVTSVVQITTSSFVMSNLIDLRVCLFFLDKSGPWFDYFVSSFQQSPFSDSDFCLLFSSFIFFNVCSDFYHFSPFYSLWGIVYFFFFLLLYLNALDIRLYWLLEICSIYQLHSFTALPCSITFG